MFDISEVYTGAMVSNQRENLVGEEEDFVQQNTPQTAEEILQHAREEAAELLENAQQQADEFLAQRRAQAEEDAETLIAQKVNETFIALGKDLWSSQVGIVQIVQQSIELMIGAIGSEKAFAFCVNKATQEYMNSQNLKVHAHPDSANRLRLYNISQSKNDETSNYIIVDDMDLEPGRCILHTGEKRIEVSLDVQIQALKRSLEGTLLQGKER